MLEQPIKENNSLETDVSSEKCLVSVIVPIYNVEDYLDRCIDSIVNQTYKNLEILLIDDGSPDNCPEMCDEWAKSDGRIRVIHKENAGLGFARNTGIENASGKYIFFFDSDDYVDKETIEKCILNAEQNNSDMVCFGFKEVCDDGEHTVVPVTSSKEIYKDEEVLNELLPELLMEKSGLGVSVWSKMFRLDTIKKNRIEFRSEREIISEDSYFIIQLSDKISVSTILAENFYFYRKNDSSLSRVYRPDRQIKNNIYLEECLKVLNTNNYPDVVEKAVKICYHSYTIGAIKQICGADLDRKTKNAELFKIYNDLVLRNTLEFDIIKFEKLSLKPFWTAMKCKQYWCCKLLLLYRLKVKK